MTCNASTTRRYLAVFLPWLSAERAIRAKAVPPEVPFVLTTAVGGAVRVVAAAATAADGLIGLTLADARARLPALHVVAHDPIADIAALEWIADGCELFSPTVALDTPDALVIDIAGCSGSGDEADLAAALRTRLVRHGFTAVLAIGSTPEMATARARFGVAAAGDLPLAALRVDPAVRLALGRAGLTTIGALAAQPRAPLAARFGTMLPTLLARLLGEEDGRLIPRRPPAPVFAERRFVEPVTTVDVVRDALDRLMTAAAGQLAAQGVGGRRFEATLFRTDGHVARLSVDTGAPTRDPAVVARLYAERIAALADPLDPGFGYDAIRFSVPVTETLAAVQLTLDRATDASAEMTALLDRLTTRLGSSRVRRLARGDSHIPERSAFDVPATADSSTWPSPPSGEPPHFPLYLFTPPQPIEVLAEVPDGPPRGFRWHRTRHEVTRAEGPERIAAEWWHRRDGRGATRDYYRLEDRDGRRFWVFRYGLYGEHTSPRWYLHGLFA